MTQPGRQGSRTGRPRDAAIDDVVLETTVALLSERGFHDVSMEDIASHAHTGKDTLYRRWPSKRLLVTAALGHLDVGSISATHGGSSEEALADYLVELDRLMMTTPVGHIVASAIGEAPHDPEIASWLTAFWRARRDEASRCLARPQPTDEDARGLAVALDLLFGALVIRWFVHGQAITRTTIVRLVRSSGAVARSSVP